MGRNPASSSKPHDLTAWMDEHWGGGVAARERMAAEIRATPMTVYRYEKGRMPQQPFLDRIAIVTGGAITANAWLGKEAADVVARRHRA